MIVSFTIEGGNIAGHAKNTWSVTFSLSQSFIYRLTACFSLINVLLDIFLPLSTISLTLDSFGSPD